MLISWFVKMHMPIQSDQKADAILQGDVMDPKALGTGG